MRNCVCGADATSCLRTEPSRQCRKPRWREQPLRPCRPPPNLPGARAHGPWQDLLGSASRFDRCRRSESFAEQVTSLSTDPRGPDPRAVITCKRETHDADGRPGKWFNQG